MPIEYLIYLSDKLNKIIKITLIILIIPFTILAVILGIGMIIFISLFLSGTICWWLSAFGLITEGNMFAFFTLAICAFFTILIYIFKEFISYWVKIKKIEEKKWKIKKTLI